MKIIFPFFIGLLLCGCINNEESEKNKIQLTSNIDSVSYALGTESVNMIPKAYPKINLSIFQNGLNDKLNKNEILDSTTCQRIINSYIKQIQQQGYEKLIQKYEPILIEGKEFLTNNSKREEVITTENGLQYEILLKGKGQVPSQNDIVEIHFYDTYIDGTVYYNSYEDGTTLTLKVIDAFPGWAEALSLMPVGSKWKLYIPYYLAFGEKGDGQKIGPFSTIISEIELINIK